MKTCSGRSKRRDQYQSDNRETNDKTKPFITIVLLILEQIAWFPKKVWLLSLQAFLTFQSFARNYSGLPKGFLSKSIHSAFVFYSTRELFQRSISDTLRVPYVYKLYLANLMMSPLAYSFRMRIFREVLKALSRKRRT